MPEEIVFPNEDKIGECKDCIYFEPYEQDGTLGHCTRIYGSQPIYLWPPVHETCWCVYFEES